MGWPALPSDYSFFLLNINVRAFVFYSWLCARLLEIDENHPTVCNSLEKIVAVFVFFSLVSWLITPIDKTRTKNSEFFCVERWATAMGCCQSDCGKVCGKVWRHLSISLTVSFYFSLNFDVLVFQLLPDSLVWFDVPRRFLNVLTVLCLESRMCWSRDQQMFHHHFPNFSKLLKRPLIFDTSSGYRKLCPLDNSSDDVWLTQLLYYRNSCVLNVTLVID